MWGEVGPALPGLQQLHAQYFPLEYSPSYAELPEDAPARAAVLEEMRSEAQRGLVGLLHDCVLPIAEQPLALSILLKAGECARQSCWPYSV